MSTVSVLTGHHSFFKAAPNDSARMLQALSRHWGYDSFRQGQEQIVQSIVSGRDACVVMPTGGGKSLCYQLPAALDSHRTAVVVSPLIALMQDQVAQLEQMGIPAGFINSTLSGQERNHILQRASQGAYRLLYLSPERVALGGTTAWLARVPVSFFAIDEAHCISEWGHDFRPEYRQLNRLRDLFPDCPIAAFTASATQRVRRDIVEQLHLRDPLKYISSFRRPNLRYFVFQCNATSQMRMLLETVRHIPEGNIIVYSPTIERVGETVDFLAENRIPAVGYHGRMDASARRQNQEKWMADEVRVLVGTTAFGLGINKSSVRAVIHLALPKTVEQYYQETGRAGRDELPADCFLFWQKKDAGLHAYFIGQITDREERERAWQRYHEVENFVNSSECRQLRICRHFGESPRWEKCGRCDTCARTPDWLAEAARPRKRRRSRPGPALRPLSEVADAGTFVAIGPDAELKEYLREWRRKTAREKGIGASSVMWDTTPDDLCRLKPKDLQELRRVAGFGDRKTAMFGPQVLEALGRFREGSRSQSNWKVKTFPPAEETLRLLEEARTFDEIAEIRGRSLRSVVTLVAEIMERGDIEFRPEWISAEAYAQITAACQQLGMERLKPIKEALPTDITYEQIRLVVAHLRAKQKFETP